LIWYNEDTLFVRGGPNEACSGWWGPTTFQSQDYLNMETPIALSLGSFLGLIGLFYTWHKDSKDTAKQIQKLETEVEQLKDYKNDIKELKSEISIMKEDMGDLQQTLTRVDTNIQHLMNN